MKTTMLKVGGFLSEKSEEFLIRKILQKVFRFTILNYYIQYMALTKCERPARGQKQKKNTYL